jgi:hypothetical protein
MKKSTKAPPYKVIEKPKHEKLPWPGLRDKSRLIRVVTRAVKNAREEREREIWAEIQIARVLEYIPPSTALRVILKEMTRRKKQSFGTLANSSKCCKAEEED